MKLIQRLLNGLPRVIKDVWYNQSAWITDRKYPVIFNSDKHYIDCKVGLKVKIGETKSGKSIYYEVSKMWRTRGGDFIYDSDAINCNLKFSHIS